ncbi:MAG: hypothetical protein CMP22_07640 [Rickettsiales bacterium]|nr:hypothetical protein [Rickettsiales bacterium]|tara:strand:- start:2344 stop:2787 length:444 start_codon:yes stop_codon:yes gene_type:complete
MTYKNCVTCEGHGQIEIEPSSTESHPCEDCNEKEFNKWKQLQEQKETLNFLWKWIERARFDPNTTHEEAISVLANYPSAPWIEDRRNWDTSHKSYDGYIDKHVNKLELFDEMVEALSLADCALSGSNMNMDVVCKKVKQALNKARGE